VVMGKHGRIIKEHIVQMQRPRNKYDWRSTPEYKELRSTMWTALQTEIENHEASV
jgi:hypothetical protein